MQNDTTTITLTAEEIARIDREREGTSLSRSAMIRLLVLRGLDAVEGARQVNEAHGIAH